MERTSVWLDRINIPTLAPLTADLHVDLCIIGAGMAGLSAAVEAAKAGLSVAVLDAGQPGAGETAMTSGHLTNMLDPGFIYVERHGGTERLRLAATAHMAAIDRIQRLSREHTIDAGFRRVNGYLFAHDADADADVDAEYEAAHRCGRHSWTPERLSAAPVGPRDRAALRFPNQAIFHPLAYVRGLVRVVQELGGRLHGQTRVTAVHPGEPARIETADGPEVTARFVLVATNSPINNLFAMHTKQAPYHSYVIGLPLPPGAVEPALYWDTADPFHYVRLLPAAAPGDSDVLIVGGEDHKTAHADDGQERWRALESWARAHFPGVGTPRWQWSGQVLNSVDGLGYYGRNPMDTANVFVATGDTGTGLTGGALAGMIVCDLILDRANPYAEIFDPARKPLTAVAEYLKEQIDVAAQYGAWLSPGDVDSVDAIPRDSGAVIRRGAQKFAVSRSAQGDVTCLSAVCPHLGCIVGWNSAASTWDCPCHGSRFRPDGTVMNGPAAAPLERVAPDALDVPAEVKP